jgi:hypothetical protein
MANLEYSRLGGTAATFQAMIQRFGVVTVMNARVYNIEDTIGSSAEAANTIVSKVLQRNASSGAIEEKSAKKPLCRLDTLKIANATQEGPSKTVSGGQYSNPLIKFGKSMRLEMQDALGSAAALDALCGTVSETGTLNDYTTVGALHVTEDFNGPKTIIGDTFFIDQKTGQQVKALIVFYQFLPDSIFNLTQDSEGDATVFDMNGDVLTTSILIKDQGGHDVEHGAFYTILDPAEVAAAQ